MATSAALEGLPKQFVSSMKTLFEIMDDRNSGYVKLTGIFLCINYTCRWSMTSSIVLPVQCVHDYIECMIFISVFILICMNYLDLENFWSEEGLSGLPKGVIESLRKVTPTSGLLSFERFCAGLKICLLRYQVILEP